MSGGRFRSPRARFFLACAVGGTIATVVFAWFALEGRPGLFDHQALANFYEVQARALLHGHWDVPRDALVFERFDVDGRYYTYFGPWPALLRLPVVLFTRDLDGDLSRVSMILAFTVLLTYASRFAWQARSLVRGDGPPTRRTLLAAGAFVLVVGCGSTALFLASSTWVYHEAILWGVAWSVASFSYLTAYLVSGERRPLVLASVTATFAYLSRGSVGLGPVAALALVLVVRLAVAGTAAWRRRRSTPDADDPGADGREVASGRPVLLRLLGLGDAAARAALRPLAIALAVPVALYAYVNYAKFGTLFGTPPYHLQDLLAARPSRQAALEANDGSLFGLEYAPTILVDYLRPDGIGFDRLFPWVTFAGPPRIFGDVVFEAENFSASLPATSTLLVVLSIIGAVAAVRALRPAGAGPTAAVLRVPILGALAGCVGMFVLAFLEERYQGDFVPLLVVAGAPGLWFAAHLLEGRGALVRRVGVALLVVLGAWSCWAMFSLTLLQQREYGPLVSTATRARLLDFQVDVHEDVPGGAPSRVLRGDLPLPPPAEPASFFVADDCAGLYWSNGRFWHPVEQTPSTGRFRLRLRVEDRPDGTREPVLAATDERGSSLLWLRHLDRERVRFEYEWTGEDQGLIEGVTPDAALIGQRTGRPARLRADGVLDVSARMDPAGYVGIRHAGRFLMSTFAPVANRSATIGRQDVSDEGATAFAGTIDSRTVPTPLCDRITRLEEDDR